MGADTKKGLRAIDFCSGNPVRYRVWAWMNAGFQGSFKQLVRKVDSSEVRVAQHLLALWDAGFIDHLPEGTPHGALTGSAIEITLIEGTCTAVPEATNA